MRPHFIIVTSPKINHDMLVSVERTTDRHRQHMVHYAIDPTRIRTDRRT